MARENDISALGATVIPIPVGATNATLIQFSVGSVANLNVKTQGGTLVIFGIPGGFSNITLAQGASIVGASLIAGASGGYLIGQSEVLSITGNPIFYLTAIGATGGAYLLLGRTGQWNNS